MDKESNALADWTPEQIAYAKWWIHNWKIIGPALEAERRGVPLEQAFKDAEHLFGKLIDFDPKTMATKN